jgi:tRNA dimethylallyltransferase
MKYFIQTFGCQANKADSERIKNKLENAGYVQTFNPQSARLIVINACSVRQSAVDRVYAAINKFKDKKIILAGCLLKTDKDRLRKKVSEIWHPNDYFDLAPNYSNSFSALIPIMTGCNNFCTFCAVPHTRGREKSRPVYEIIKEVRNLVQKGYKEIWLLGQNVNSYQTKSDFKTNAFIGKLIKDSTANPKALKSRLAKSKTQPANKKIDFSGLLRLINALGGEFWIRFTSPHPKNFSDELISAIARLEKVTKYINLPVQSGDNKILKKMNRGYTREQYIKLVKKIRKKIPDVTLSTDTIVGFAGESKKQFQNTVALYKKLKFDMAFIAEYSPRPNTAAALTMKDSVSHGEKERRRKILTKILEKTALQNNKKLVGQTVKVLVDSEKNGRFFGRNEGNKVVEIAKPKNKEMKIGEFVDVKITKAEPWKLRGELTKKRVIVVLGPNASGKSDLAVKLAKKFNGEIISADSRQIYKGLDIATGKITKKEMQGIKHYLLDVQNPKKVFTAIDFKKLATKAVEEIIKKGKTPIVCGGTGFYIETLLGKNLRIPEVKPDWKLREKLEKKPINKLLSMLKNLNKQRAKNIDPRNKRRIIRAIEIAKKLGKVPRLETGRGLNNREGDYEILWLGIKRPQKILERRIKKRLLKRLKRGMVGEVKNLHYKKGVSWKRLEELGLEYRYVSRYLRKKMTREEMIARLEKEINKYAKRQMTWFKKYSPNTRWIKNYKEAEKLAKKFLQA